MAPRTIVGIGEALLRDTGDRQQPAGLGLMVPTHAVALGHEGVAISRIGQDATGHEVTAWLQHRGVDVRHLQTDPDLPTGRELVRAGSIRRLEGHVAFDNLQWDFDLSDIAQQADAVVFDRMIRRSGQSRSTTDRFLAECELAFRLFDLTGCGDQKLDRGHALAGLRLAQAVVVDEPALQLLVPGHTGSPGEECLLRLLGQHGLSIVVVAPLGRPLTACNSEGSVRGTVESSREVHEALLVGLLHGVLSGWALDASVRLADRFAVHVSERPDERVSAELLDPERS